MSDDEYNDHNQEYAGWPEGVDREVSPTKKQIEDNGCSIATGPYWISEIGAAFLAEEDAKRRASRKEKLASGMTDQEIDAEITAERAAMREQFGTKEAAAAALGAQQQTLRDAALSAELARVDTNLEALYSSRELAEAEILRLQAALEQARCEVVKAREKSGLLEAELRLLEYARWRADYERQHWDSGEEDAQNAYESTGFYDPPPPPLSDEELNKQVNNEDDFNETYDEDSDENWILRLRNMNSDAKISDQNMSHDWGYEASIFYDYHIQKQNESYEADE